MTNLDPDVSDLYLEKVTGKTYLYGGQQVPLAERDEVIRIAGEQLEADHRAVHAARSAALRRLGRALQRRAPTPRCRPTRPTGSNGYAVALAWTALTAAADGRRALRVRRGVELDRVPRGGPRSSPYPARTSCTPTPAGNIGYQAPGAIPIRKGGRDGRLPGGRAGCRRTTGPGATCRSTRCPTCSTRAEGFIVTANQAVTGPDYRWYLTDSPGPGLPQPADPQPDHRGDRRTAPARRRRHDRACSSTRAARSRPCWCPT